MHWDVASSKGISQLVVYVCCDMFVVYRLLVFSKGLTKLLPNERGKRLQAEHVDVPQID